MTLHEDTAHLASWAEHMADGAPETNGGPPGERSSWAPVDLGRVLDGEGDLEPAPAVLARTDGKRLLYAGKIHLLASEPESGKGWLSLLAAKAELEQGHHVLYIDLEDEAAVAVSRLQALGVSDTQIREHFHYVRPDEPFSAEAQDEIESLIERSMPSLAVVDGMTEALALAGIDLRDNTEVANWMRGLPGLLRRRGIAVVLIDHVTKASESRGRYAIGAQHKLGKADVSYHLQVKEPLGRGLTGRVLIKVVKDRPGHVRQMATNGWVAELHAESLPGGAIDLSLEPAAEFVGADTFRPTGLMEKVSRAVAQEPGLSVRGIRGAVTGKKDYVERARECLVAEGFIDRREEGSAVRHYPIKPYIEADDESADEG